MAYRRFLRYPIATLAIALGITAMIVGCGGAAEDTAASAAPAPAQQQQQTQQQAQPAATQPPAQVRATNTPVPQDATLAPTPTQRASVLQATPRPTLAPQTEGELVTDRLIAVLDPPSLESMLDCEVTGSGVVNYRMSAEFMVDAGRFDGSYEPMLATEWSITPDGKTWNFKLRQGVRWHDDWGEFTAKDVKHSLSYYTNPECRASYSDYFRNDPGSDVEIVNDYEVNIHMEKRPAVDFIYWFSGYRGVPISSKAQWDQACPGGEADYETTEAGSIGYCKASRDAVYAKSARTGPYEYVSFEEGVGWEWSRVDYDHWRVNPDFAEIEIKDVREPATRLAIMQAREGHIAAINRALLQDAIDDGLEVFDSSVTAQTTFAIFGGMYFATGEKGIDPNASAEAQAADREAYNIVAARDEKHPWNDPGESGKLVRMAMNKALDRDQINDAIFKGAGGRQWVATLGSRLRSRVQPGLGRQLGRAVRIRPGNGQAIAGRGRLSRRVLVPHSGVPVERRAGNAGHDGSHGQVLDRNRPGSPA